MFYYQSCNRLLCLIKFVTFLKVNQESAVFSSFFAYVGEDTLVKSPDAASSVYCPPDSAAVNRASTVGHQGCVIQQANSSDQERLIHSYTVL